MADAQVQAGETGLGGVGGNPLAHVERRSCPYCGKVKVISLKGLAVHVERKHPSDYGTWIATVEGGALARAADDSGVGEKRRDVGGELVSGEVASTAAPEPLAPRSPQDVGVRESPVPADFEHVGLAVDEYGLVMLEAAVLVGDEFLAEALGIDP